MGFALGPGASKMHLVTHDQHSAFDLHLADGLEPHHLLISLQVEELGKLLVEDQISVDTHQVVGVAGLSTALKRRRR